MERPRPLQKAGAEGVGHCRSVFSVVRRSAVITSCPRWNAAQAFVGEHGEGHRTVHDLNRSLDRDEQIESRLNEREQLAVRGTDRFVPAAADDTAAGAEIEAGRAVGDRSPSRASA